MPAYPRMTAYLQALPLGLDSYPNHLQKGSMVRIFTGSMPTAPLVELPKTLELLLRHPTHTWVPEVHVNALLLAQRDVSVDSDEAFVAAFHRANTELLTGAIYRVLLAFASPEFLIKAAESRWTVFHRGIGLSVTERSPGRGTLRLTYPVGLMPEIIARAYSTAFEVALKASNAKNVSVRVEPPALTSTLFHCSWE